MDVLRETIRRIIAEIAQPPTPEEQLRFYKNDLKNIDEFQTPTADDFKCAIDRGSFEQQPRCLRAGLSCAVEAAALERRRERIPRLRTHQIASASLSQEHGNYAQTTSIPDHYTMWLRKRALAAAPTLFSCMGAGT